MQQRVVCLAVALVLLAAVGCAKNSPVAPWVPAGQENEKSAECLRWGSGEVAYVVHNMSTNLWEFRQLSLGPGNKSRLLFALPAANSGEIADMDFQARAGFVFIQRNSNPIYQSVWTVAKSGGDLRVRNIQPYVFYKESLHWNEAGNKLSVTANSGGETTYLHIYGPSLADPADIILGGESGLWTADRRLVYFNLGDTIMGVGKLPDHLMLADSNGANPVPWLEETGYPRDCSRGNRLLYIFGGPYPREVYGIKVRTIGSAGPAAVLQANLPIDGYRLAHVRYTQDERHIVFETSGGIYIMTHNGGDVRKLADGRFPAVMK
jgi:hypothetical protein